MLALAVNHAKLYSNLYVNNFTRLLSILLLLVPISTTAQTDAFEKIEIPYRENDFVKILTFWRQFNSVKTKDLMRFNSIKFYKDDTLKYTYNTDNLKSFERNTAFADSAISASTDSIYNKEQNSFDFYFTDIAGNRPLDHRKYLNNKGQYYKVERFSEGNVTIRTKWIFNDENDVIEEMNEFTEDSLMFTTSYKRNGALISQKHVKVKSAKFEYEYIITYDKKGEIIAYSYKGDGHNCSLKTQRRKDNLASKLDGFVNDKAVNFSFSYSANTIGIVRKNADGARTTFKLVML